MKKRGLSLMLAVLLVIMALPFANVTAYAATMEYAVTGGSVFFDPQAGFIVGHSGDVTAVTIPEEINGAKVLGIGDGAFEACYSLTEVTLPEGIQSIGSAAFYECENLKSINLPESLVEIGPAAFYSCRGLESVTVPAGVKTIMPWAFGHCHGLQSVTIPEGVTTIEESAFFSCETLTEVVIPEGVSTIGNAAFSWCRAMTDVTIPMGVITIGDHAFSYCYSLRSANLPEGVTSIGSSAFSYGYDLTSVTIPVSLTNIGATAFEYCGSGMNIYYNGSREQWMAIAQEGNDFSNVSMHFAVCNHSYEKNEIAPTCMQAGYTTYTCTQCGDTYTADHVDALGHDLRSVEEKKPTCEEAGWEAYETCSRCDYTTYAELSALMHEYTDGLCTRCGAADPNYEKPGHICPSIGFSDIPAYDNWAHEGIDYCVEHELMHGIGNGLFNPNGTVSRAQLVTILYRVAGSPETEFKGTFTDVPDNQWYSKAIEWAAENGVVNGIGSGKFGPDLSITREQIATILYRYEKEPAVTGNLSTFPDHDKVNTFAENAMIWATREELINGISSNGVTTLTPQNNATRAQIASIIMRYLEK